MNENEWTDIMTKAESLKRTRRLNRVRRLLHLAESKIWFDKPTFSDTEAALNVLNDGLSPRLIKKFFIHNHIELVHSFWVKTNDRHHIIRFATASDALLIFKQIVHYCNGLSRKYGQTAITNDISNPLE